MKFERYKSKSSLFIFLAMVGTNLDSTMSNLKKKKKKIFVDRFIYIVHFVELSGK